MIETERLVLRAWRDADKAPFWDDLGADAEVMRFLPTMDRAASDALIDRLEATEAEHGMCFWAAERKRDSRLLGLCGIMPARDPLSEPEIGWRLARHAWGQGYATEAARAALDWAWANLPDDTVVAITVPANLASQRVMERIGMTRAAAEDFDHPALPQGDPLRRHVLYRIRRPA